MGGTSMYKLRDHAHPKNEEFWPSPTHNDYRSGGTDPQKAAARIAGKGKDKRNHDLPAVVVSRLCPTPQANPPGFKNIEIVDKDGNPPAGHNQRWYDKNSGRVVQKGLQQAVNWATPNTFDALPPKSPESLQREMEVNRPGRSQPANLRDQIGNARNWPTPQALDGHKYNDRTAEQCREAGSWPQLPNVAAPGRGGLLNPDWVEWLMGWPIGWSSLAPLSLERYEEWLHGMNDGSWWDIDPYDTGEMDRIGKRTKERNNRIRAIGNGQVPLAAHKAWELLGQPSPLIVMTKKERSSGQMSLF